MAPPPGHSAALTAVAVAAAAASAPARLDLGLFNPPPPAGVLKNEEELANTLASFSLPEKPYISLTFLIKIKIQLERKRIRATSLLQKEKVS